MNTLAEDLAELNTDKSRAWARRRRRECGIAPDEAACWLAVVEQARPFNDRAVVGLGRSPLDVLLDAHLHVESLGGAYRRLGLGTWMLEVYGEEGVDPAYLRVYPAFDEPQP